MRVDCLEIVPDHLHRRLWEIYEESFRKLRELSPVRQYFLQGEFVEAMTDPGSLKFLLWRDTELIGIGIATNQLSRVPWINAHFYRLHFPEALERGRLWYIEAIAVPPGLRGGRAAIRLLQAMFREWDKRGEVGAFDFDSSNESLVRLLKFVGGKSASGGFQELGTQHYWAFKKG